MTGRGLVAVSACSLVLVLAGEAAQGYINGGRRGDRKGPTVEQLKERWLSQQDELVRSRPNDAAPVYQRANFHWQENRHEKALEDLDAAIRIDPGFAKASLHRAHLQCRFGRYGKAASDLEATIAQSKDAALVNEATQRLAEIRFACPDGRHRDLRAARDLATTLGTSAASRLLAAIHADLGDFDASIAALKRTDQEAFALEIESLKQQDVPSNLHQVADDFLAGKTYPRGFVRMSFRQESRESR